MKSPSTPRRRPSCASPRIHPVAAACGLLLAVGAAQAQQSANQLETVVVTGIRGSIESSISVKRNADGIVEAVTAEDLGKLPDLSIAESLARLPGLAAQRVNGNAQVLSIRGMAPKYGVTLLNGREMVSSGSDRSVEFDQFPAELMGGATVYKTPDASLGTQGLSGTVNMQTIRPLNFKGRQGNLNARLEKNSNGEQIPGLSSQGKRLSASYVDQFADRTIGVAVGVAHLDSPEQQQHYANWWWANTANESAYPPSWCGGDCGLKGVARDAVSLQGFEATAFSTNQVRNGLMGVLEYKPNDRLHTVVDLYYSNFSKEYVGREFQGEMNTWNGVTYRNPVYEVFGGEKITVGGAIDNISAKLLSRRNKREDTIKALGINNELKLDKDWTGVLDLSYSKANRDEKTAEMYAGPTLPSGFSSTAISMNGFSQFVPTIDWADPSKVQLQQFWGQMGAARIFDVQDELKSVKLSAKRNLDWGAVHQFEAGINYAERSKDYKAVKEAYDLKSGATNLAFPNGILMAPATLGFGSIPTVANFDVQAVLDTGLFSSRPDDLSSAPNREWGVREKVTTGFAKFNLEFNAGVPVRGNLGLQVVHAQQEGQIGRAHV
jgi:iron complex outermembrane receptor protein